MKNNEELNKNAENQELMDVENTEAKESGSKDVTNKSSKQASKPAPVFPKVLGRLKNRGLRRKKLILPLPRKRLR